MTNQTPSPRSPAADPDSEPRGAVSTDPAARVPSFSRADAEALARELWGVEARASDLPSERDRNFRLDAASGERFVLRISNAAEDRVLLECQNAILDRLSADDTFRFPGPVAGLAGDVSATATSGAGEAHMARLVAWVPGVPLAEASPHTPALLRRVGALMGRVGAALEGFEHPAADRPFYWDLRHGAGVIARHIDAVTDPDRRALVRRMGERALRQAEPYLDELRTAVVHNDANDHNILVSAPGPDPLAAREVTGLLDFGDVVRSWLVADPAIAAAYAMLGKRDPLAAAAAVARGYHEAYPLTEPEAEALYPLSMLRLCMSVVLAAHQRSLRPDNAYLSISEAPAWALLERLDAVHPRWACYTLRDACGLEPCPAGGALVRWLESSPGIAGPVLEPNPRSAGTVVLDLSVGATEREPGLDADPEAWTRLLWDRMRAAGATIGIGRYDEPRPWYTAPLFRAETDAGDDWRSIHLGLDLFADPGTPVLAPLDGVVEELRDNAGEGDYGPTLILRHEPDGGPVFHTLYGHLSRASIARLEPGAAVRRGERLAALGAPDENGGWAPHLHFQLIADLLDRNGEYPGVARPADRRVLKSLSPDPNLLARIAGLEPAGAGTADAEILEARRWHLGPNLSVSYRRPIQIVRGRGVWLYDPLGQPYLDCVNNVAHVGHEHPAVVDAGRRQMATLNTNSRYLHPLLPRYAARLAATLPAPLSVIYLVCTGSEANELALRLARTHTGREDVVAIEGAYHGNTGTLVDVSSYKHDGPGGRGAPGWVRKVAMPDLYRGVHRADDPEAAVKYAEEVRRASKGAAAFIHESVLSCGGQIVLPDGYLEAAYAHVRGGGGVCIADEVQVGLGRVGSRFWGFETQHVVPDIVTMGKPLGNGHPLAAVATTPEIAASFDNGMEYFNTFGGNPVSCAIGLAVLAVIERESLQERARLVGAHLLERLGALGRRHAIIGDVRGLGLFLGIELVLDRDSLEPAPRHAAYVVERMRDHRILLSTDGPLHNVIKIKPPLAFSNADADRLVDTLDAVLGEDAVRAARVGAAPTAAPPTRSFRRDHHREGSTMNRPETTSAAYGGPNWSPRSTSLTDELGTVWASCGIDSEWRPLKRVLLHRPGPEFETDDADAALFLDATDAAVAGRQHDALVEAYRGAGVEVTAVDPPVEPPPNQVFCADLMFMTPAGAVVGRPASRVRAGEERWIARRLADMGVPILRCVGGTGVFEGADAMWLNAETVLIGCGLRTNMEGVVQVASTLAELGVQTIQVDLTHGTMHLMGRIRIVDRDLAFVEEGRLPWTAVDALSDFGHDVRVFPDPDENRAGFAHNFVTLGPRRILMPAGNPRTEAVLAEAGVECITVDVSEIGKAAGSIGCMTAVVERER